MRTGDRVFHSENSDLGLGEVLDLFADGTWIHLHHPVSGATKAGIYPIAKLRIAEQAVAAPKPDGPLAARILAFTLLAWGGSRRFLL